MINTYPRDKKTIYTMKYFCQPFPPITSTGWDDPIDNRALKCRSIQTNVPYSLLVLYRGMNAFMCLQKSERIRAVVLSYLPVEIAVNTQHLGRIITFTFTSLKFTSKCFLRQRNWWPLRSARQIVRDVTNCMREMREQMPNHQAPNWCNLTVRCKLLAAICQSLVSK